MTEQNQNNQELEEIIESVSSSLNADVLFYNGPIERPSDQNIIDKCISRNRKENILLILVTYGGDADPAFRIAKCLQTKYEKFIFYASGYCKSAGTLIALGANEIIFSDHGELGPLDVQMNKKDDLFSLQSGNTVMDALGALQDKAFLSFEKTFLEIQKRSEGAITVKTAGEFATNLASGLFSNLFGQIDPLYVGESARALSIAHAYGERLIEDSKNWTAASLEQLLSGYPSHGFVIDRHEAQDLFNYVREPDGDEIILTNMMGDFFRKPKHKGLPTIEFLNKEKVEEKLNLVPKSGEAK